MPKVSVVLITLNAGEFLGPAVDSILAQSFRDFEVIAIDSASSDGTRERLAGVGDPRLRPVDLPCPCGVALPRNLGIALAQGELIAVMDADDVMHPERLARQAAFLDANPDIQVLGSSFVLMRGAERQERRQPAEDGVIKARLVNVNGNAMHDPTVMMRADFLREHALGYPPLETDASHGLWLDCLRAGARFANLEEPLLFYRRHGRNHTVLKAERMQRTKRSLRVAVLQTLLPDLPSSDCADIARVMEERRALGLLEATAGLRAIERADRIRLCAHGADRDALMAVLAYHHGRVARLLEAAIKGEGAADPGPAAGHADDDGGAATPPGPVTRR